MKKTIPFDLFEQGQTIYFDILRLAEFEKAMGVPIQQILHSGNAGINFCLAGLQVGLKHHNRRATPGFYADKISEYLDEGGTIDEIAILIIRAIVASGLFGKEVTERAEENLVEEKNG